MADTVSAKTEITMEAQAAKPDETASRQTSPGFNKLMNEGRLVTPIKRLKVYTKNRWKLILITLSSDMVW